MTERYTDFYAAEDVEDVRSDDWRPVTDDMAEWALMKIQEAKATIAHHQAERDAAIARWDRYVEQATREAERTMAFFEGKLHGYLLALQASGKLGHKKSYTLPSGRLQLRHVEARFEPQDHEAVRAYAEAVDAVKVTVAPDMARVRELCASGVDVPGMVMVRPSGEKFSIAFQKESAGEA